MPVSAWPGRQPNARDWLADDLGLSFGRRGDMRMRLDVLVSPPFGGRGPQRLTVRTTCVQLALRPYWKAGPS